MFISALLFLSSVTAAVPAGNEPWFEFHDYPVRAFEKHYEGVTRFDLLVDPRGRVASCKVIQSSGRDDLDRTTCSLAKFRARFAPARGADGQAVYGVYRSQAVWVIPEDTLPNTEPGPDLQVSINRLPDGTLNPPAVQLAYLVGPEGKISDCNLLRGAPAQPAALVDVACRELESRLPAQPATTAGGERVPVVRTAAILFTAPAEAAKQNR